MQLPSLNRGESEAAAARRPWAGSVAVGLALLFAAGLLAAGCGEAGSSVVDCDTLPPRTDTGDGPFGNMICVFDEERTITANLARPGDDFSAPTTRCEPVPENESDALAFCEQTFPPGEPVNETVGLCTVFSRYTNVIATAGPCS